MPYKQSKGNAIFLVLRVIVFILCLGFILNAFQRQPPISFATFFIFKKELFFLFLLSILNWVLEIIRWHFSINVIKPTHLGTATQQILMGQALNWVMPFTTGDLMAKLLKGKNKKKTVALIFINRFFMFVLTLIYGLVGVYYFLSAQSFSFVLVVVFLLVVFFFCLGFVKKKYPILQFTFTVPFLLKLAGFTLIRYGVFTFQFVYILSIFNPEINPILLFAGVGWIFFFRTFIPSLFGNFGVRESSAWAFFNATVSHHFVVIFPCFVMWFFNQVFPSVLGLFYLIKFRFKANK